MNKWKIFSLLLVWLFSFGCEEIPPPIDNGDGALVLRDTNYVLPSLQEPAQDKGILIEDLTGVRCPNCPDAAMRAKELKDNNPDRVVVVGLYTEQPNNLTFPHSGDDDLRTVQATNLYTNIYGSPPLPGGGVNRKIYSGQNQINQVHALWGSSVQNEKPLKTVVNLSVEVQQKDDSTYVVQSKFTFNEELNSQSFVSIMLLENEIHASQSTDTGDNHEYIHQHVLRTMYTPYNGSPLYDSPEKGRVIEKGWEFVIPKGIDLSKASIVVLVNRNDADNKEVLQCLEVKL